MRKSNRSKRSHRQVLSKTKDVKSKNYSDKSNEKVSDSEGIVEKIFRVGRRAIVIERVIDFIEDVLENVI